MTELLFIRIPTLRTKNQLAIPSGNLLKHPDGGSTLSAEKENFLFLFVSQEQTSFLCSEGKSK